VLFDTATKDYEARLECWREGCISRKLTTLLPLNVFRTNKEALSQVKHASNAWLSMP
jgi:hypothetical protein